MKVRQNVHWLDFRFKIFLTIGFSLNFRGSWQTILWLEIRVTGLVLQIFHKAVANRASKSLSPGSDSGESYEKHLYFRVKMQIKNFVVRSKKDWVISREDGKIQ